MSEDPSTNRERLPDGKFAVGNKGGPGNPQAAKLQAYRKAIWECVSIEDVQKVMRAMVDKACDDKDVAAAKIVLERTAGKPPEDIENATGDFVDDIAARIRAAIAQARALDTADKDPGDKDTPQ